MPGQIAGGGLKEKLRLHIFEYVTAAVFCLVGINYLTDTSGAGTRSSIGEAMHPFDVTWSLFYIAAAPFIIFGLTKEKQNLRIAGLNLLGVGLTMQFIAAITTTPLEPRDFAFLLYAVACFLRAYLAIQNVKPGVRRHASNR